jgi:RNA polymerase sigma-70 factor (ECF subfamily)
MPRNASAVRNGELEQLYELRFSAFARTAYAITGDTETARDVVQEAFAVAVGRGASFNGSGPLEGWLWRIVVRRALDERRRTRRERVANTVAAEEPVAGSGADGFDMLAAIRRLPERQRLTLFLRYYADLDYAAIAEVLGVSPGTVGASLHAAHNALEVRLQRA